MAVNSWLSSLDIGAPTLTSRRESVDLLIELFAVMRSRDGSRPTARSAILPPQEQAEGSGQHSGGLAELSDALQRPIVLMIEAVERYASSDLLYELKAARDKLNSSSHNGLFLALFGTDPLVLRSLCRHHMAAFFCAEFLDIRAEREHV